MVIQKETPTTIGRKTIRLGLIGGNIGASRAPELHRVAGALEGLDVRYDLFNPIELGRPFEDVLAHCRGIGLDAVNITYPYKEDVIRFIQVDDPVIRQIGAVNTVDFRASPPRGFNTDYTGFVAAYRSQFGDRPPGVVAMIGAGGVGRAVASGLIALGAAEIRLFDVDRSKALALAAALIAAARGRTAVKTSDTASAALEGADAAINCTPVGMVGRPGSPVPEDSLAGIRWAFDAVYTPVETQFKRDVERHGAVCLSGYELFFFQGIHAFEIFVGHPPRDVDELRRRLRDARPA